ncbi:hypothetical protein Leryth_018438 [Lithospermum erythrorhizon]|nr:hypothetical protein Leryth_018438 [Lithospermum erythrorhizon]
MDNNIILDPPPPPSTSSPPRKAAQLPPPHPPPPRTPPSSSISRHPSADLSFLDSIIGGGGGGGGGGISGFLRQSSSPAEFLAEINSDGYFSSFGVPPNVDYLLPSTTSFSKRPRDDSESTTSKLAPSPLKVERSTELQGEIGGLLDAELEKLTEDAVLCRVRAKRGCATHPRSIAERVRRTRISDRIRKLQDLVPNMDKESNRRYFSDVGMFNDSYPYLSDTGYPQKNLKHFVLDMVHMILSLTFSVILQISCKPILQTCWTRQSSMSSCYKNRFRSLQKIKRDAGVQCKDDSTHRIPQVSWPL